MQRIETAVGPYDHYRPAAHLMREQGRYMEKVGNDTLDRFEELFGAVNSLLE